MEEFLTVGNIVNTHGVNGELKVMPLTSDISRFDYLKLIWLDINGKITEHFVEKVRYHKDFVLLTLRGIDTMDKAAALKGCSVKVDRKHSRPLEDNEFFIADLIGCQVFENGVLLGTITDVLETGSNDVYVTEGEKYGEILIPALEQVVRRVDVEKQQIDVVLPEGLVER
ncbi:MAG: 16S rRNA processing protein RimM [Thermoclostridium sp.]|nr:16S rRNA processing protein RimM [Thermoclostridium sp.]